MIQECDLCGGFYCRDEEHECSAKDVATRLGDSSVEIEDLDRRLTRIEDFFARFNDGFAAVLKEERS